MATPGEVDAAIRKVADFTANGDHINLVIGAMSTPGPKKNDATAAFQKVKREATRGNNNAAKGLWEKVKYRVSV